MLYYSLSFFWGGGSSWVAFKSACKILAWVSIGNLSHMLWPAQANMCQQAESAGGVPSISATSQGTVLVLHRWPQDNWLASFWFPFQIHPKKEPSPRITTHLYCVFIDAPCESQDITSTRKRTQNVINSKERAYTQGCHSSCLSGHKKGQQHLGSTTCRQKTDSFFLLGCPFSDPLPNVSSLVE